MKNSSPARTHSVMELGPAAAAVANHLRLTTATMLKSTMSRSPSVHGSVGWAAAVSGAAVDGEALMQVSPSGRAHGDRAPHGEVAIPRRSAARRYRAWNGSGATTRCRRARLRPRRLDTRRTGP